MHFSMLSEAYSNKLSYMCFLFSYCSLSVPIEILRVYGDKSVFSHCLYPAAVEHSLEKWEEMAKESTGQE